MIVPDFTPYSGSNPAAVYNRMMASLVDQRSGFRPYCKPSPRPPGLQPGLPGAPSHFLHGGSPPNFFRTDPFLTRPMFGASQKSEVPTTVQSDLRKEIPTRNPPMVDHKLTNSDSVKADLLVSPISSEGGSGLSPSSEVSQLAPSSEDGDDMADMEDGDRKAFKCPQCLYFTDRKNNLKRHIVTMHQECSKTLECCGAMFHSKAALRDHVGLFHRGGYRCQICSRNFCRKALLRRHLTVHSGRKDFSCNLCGYATSHKSNLERHQKVHLRRPVFPTHREITDNALEISNEDRNKRYYPKFRHHREKPINRFVLLPNRLQYTHASKCKTEGQRSRILEGINKHDMDSKLDEDTIMCIDPESVTSPTSTIPSSTSPQTDIENIAEVNSRPSLTTKQCPKHLTNNSLLSSRRRIFVTPYKCSDCAQCFTNQTSFHGHNCRIGLSSPNAGLSVINAVKKGKIKLLLQPDPSGRTQHVFSESANENCNETKSKV